MKVYDKTKDYPFKGVRFPNLLSEIPEQQAYGVFIGLLHRFYRICNYPNLFLTASVDVEQTLDSQGCKYMKLVKVFLNFLSSKRKLRWPIKITTLTKIFRSLFYTICNDDDLNEAPFS